MGCKYIINYRQYDEMCFREYQTNNFIFAICKLMCLKAKYEIVDFSYRK